MAPLPGELADWLRQVAAAGDDNALTVAVATCRHQGYSYTAIGHVLGVKRETLSARVRRWQRQAGVPGPPHPATAKLTAEDVAEARRMVAGGASVSAAARLYGVSVPTMADAVYGVTWTSVRDPAPPPRRTEPPGPQYPDHCTVPGCPSDSREQGLCPSHLYRKQRYGDPLAGPLPAHRKGPWRRPKLTPGDPRHGSQVAYGYYRCRCPKCKEWAWRSRDERRQLKA